MISINRKPHGFWKIEQNAFESLAPYVHKLGYIPSLPELYKLDSRLARAINRYYPMEVVYGWFGLYFKKRKQPGFWSEEEKIEIRFKEIVNELGYIPSANKLIELGHQDIVSAMSRHKYKLTTIRKRFGMEEQNQKDRKKYKDIQLVLDEVKEFVLGFNGTPTIEDFRNNGKHHLVKAMYETHGISYSYVLDKLGLEKNKMDKGFWHSHEVIIKTAINIIKEYGYLPSPRELGKEKKYLSFCHAVFHYYKGFHKLRDDLGLTQLKKKQGFWKDEQTLLNDLKGIIKIYGHIPTYLHRKGYGYLESALQHYGGVYNFAKKHNLPLENTRVPYTHYDDEERLDTKVKELIEQFGDFPSYSELVHHGEWAVLYRLCNKYGNIAEASSTYGYKNRVIKSLDGHLCDSFSERIVDDFLLGCNVPHERYVELELMGVKLVPDFVLSLDTVIEVLMFDYRLPIESEMQEAYVKRYLKKRQAYIESNFTLIEVFPHDLRSKVILDEKLYDLIKPFAKSQIKDLSIVPLSFKSKRPPGYWKLFENVKKELLPICIELGRFPTKNELKERGIPQLESISRLYHGGLNEVAKKLGFSRKNKKRSS